MQLATGPYNWGSVNELTADVDTSPLSQSHIFVFCMQASIRVRVYFGHATFYTYDTSLITQIRHI